MAHIKKVFRAAQMSQWEQVNELIQHYGVSIDEYIHPRTGDTLLHYASKSFNGDTAIQILLEYIDVNSTNCLEYTPLHILTQHCISRCNSDKHVKEEVAISKTYKCDNFEQRCFDTIEKCVVRAELLIAAGADVNLYPTNPHLASYGISPYLIISQYKTHKQFDKLVELFYNHGGNLGYVKELYKSGTDSINL